MIEKGIARILNKVGTPVGIGFLAAPNIVLTCAHVVSAALGETNHPERMVDQPKGGIWVDFPLSDGQVRKIRITTTVIGWQPYKKDNAGDLAALWLTDPLPNGILPIPIRIKADLWKHPIRAYGVPVGYDQGVWAEGEILSRQSMGYFQVQSTSTNSYRIQPGFSGGPLWSDQINAVVGMLTEADSAPGVWAAFAIPSRMLIQFTDALRVPSNNGNMPSLTVSSSQVSSIPSVINTLGELQKLSPTLVVSLSQSYYAAAMHPMADSEDLLNGALTQLVIKKYDVVATLLLRILSKQPDHGYALYASGLVALRGQRPAAIKDFNRMRTLVDPLRQAVLLLPKHCAAWVLLCYVLVDYFQRNGFGAQIVDLPVYMAEARASQLDRAELEALAQQLPDIRAFSLYSELYALA